MNLTRQQLLTGGRLQTDTVAVADGKVAVRGLTRAEALQVRAAGDTPTEQEPVIVHLGMVDPQLSITEVHEWFAVAPAGDVQDVCLRITQLSGMAPDSAKETTKSAVGDGRSDARVLPGGPVGHDGGPAAYLHE